MHRALILNGKQYQPSSVSLTMCDKDNLLTHEEFIEIWGKITTDSTRIIPNFLRSVGEWSGNTSDTQNEIYSIFTDIQLMFCEFMRKTGRGSHNPQDNMTLDHHKIGACLTLAILITRPFKLACKENLTYPKKLLLANELLALYSGVYWIRLGMATEVKNYEGNDPITDDDENTPPITDKEKDEIAKTYLEYDLKYPRSMDDTKTYDEYLVQNLLLALPEQTGTAEELRAKNQSFVLWLSHIYYFLEAYNSWHGTLNHGFTMPDPKIQKLRKTPPKQI